MSASTPYGSVLTKMVIYSYQDKDFQQLQSMFTIPINPETFGRNYKIDLDTRAGHGQPGTQPGYKASPPDDLKIDFILDGTGAVQGYPAQLAGMTVHDQLTMFLECSYKFNTDTHRPPFCIVVWGADVNFKGVLSSADLTYSLFLPSGDPLRVKVSATFKSSETDQQRAKASSPDLTKSQQVRKGDRLDLLAYKYYNDPDYLLQVAQVNNLVTIRWLKPGSTLFFPPFAQQNTTSQQNAP